LYETDELMMAVMSLVSRDAVLDPWGLAARFRAGPGEKNWRGGTMHHGVLGFSSSGSSKPVEKNSEVSSESVIGQGIVKVGATGRTAGYEEWQTILSELADVMDTLLEGEARPSSEAPMPTRQVPVDTEWPAMPMATGDPKKELLIWGSEVAKRSVGMSWPDRMQVVAAGLAKQNVIVEEQAKKKGIALTDGDWAAWRHVLTSMVLVAAHWAMAGYPTLRPTHKLAASLMATHIPKELVPEVRMPWPSFLVEVPEGVLPDEGIAIGAVGGAGTAFCIEPSGKVPGKVRVRVVGLLTGEGEHGPEIGLFVGSGYDSADPGLRKAVHISDMPLGSLSELADLKGFRGFYEPALVKLLGRFLLNMMIEVDSPKYRSEIGRGPPRSSSSKKDGGREKGALPSTWLVEVRREVKLDARGWVSDYVRSKGTSPSVQTLVRGHRKRQPYGPRGMSLRRWIHVEPYWRGPEDAPVVARTMVMDEQQPQKGTTP
jgi:hypothetical protein